MRLDNLKNICRRKYGTTPDIWKSVIADYNFDSAQAEVDDATVAVIKEACEIAGTSATPAQAKDNRVDVLVSGYQQLLQSGNAQIQSINNLNAKVESLQSEVTMLRSEASKATAQLIAEVEALKVVEPEPVQIPASLPQKFAQFQDVFG